MKRLKWENTRKHNTLLCVCPWDVRISSYRHHLTRSRWDLTLLTIPLVRINNTLIKTFFTLTNVLESIRLFSCVFFYIWKNRSFFIIFWTEKCVRNKKKIFWPFICLCNIWMQITTFLIFWGPGWLNELGSWIT